MSRGRKDTNQNAIVLELRQIGFDVDILSQYPRHPYDLVVTRNGYSVRIELKSPGEKLTPREQTLQDARNYPVLVAYSTADVLAWFGII